MPQWPQTPDGRAAQDLIINEIKTRGWDKLIPSSSRTDKETGQAQKRQFSRLLQNQYPLADKSIDAWVKFISDVTGKVKKRTSSSAAYRQAVDKPGNEAKVEARLQVKAGKHLTPAAREAQGLTLTPVQDKLLAP